MMKNLKRILRLSIMALLFIGCHSEDINENSTVEENVDISLLNDKDYIQTAELNEKLAYKEFHLSNIMEQVLEINPDFEEMNEFKSAKGEEATFYLENVLLRSIEQKQSSAKKDPFKSLEAFIDLEGESWYPVLKRLKKRRGNGKRAIYLFNGYDEVTGKEFVKAFKVNKRGKLKLLKRNFSKKMFDTDSESGKGSSSYYQLSIVSCPPEGDMQKSAKGCSGGGGGGTPSSFKLKTINIKDKKESWIERADIHHTAVFWDFIEPNVYYSSIFYNISGHRIRKVKNKELNKNLSVNEFLTSRNANGVLQYVIFEHDNWPAIKQKSRMPGPFGTTFVIEYRSWNRDYDHQLLDVNQNNSGIPSISNYSENKNEIYYKIQ